MIGFVLAPPVGLEPTTPSLAVPDEKLPWSVVFLSTAAPSCPRSSCPRQRSVTMQLTASGCLYKLPLTEFNLKKNKDVQKNVSIFGSPSWTRTNDTAVNSRVLYRLSYGGILKPTKQSLIGYLCRHRPIFPGRFQPSIFGTNELNYRVRNGNGWTLIVINTD